MRRVLRRLRVLRRRRHEDGAAARSPVPGLAAAHDAIGDDNAYAGEVEAARYIEANTPEGAVVLTGTQHKNPVAALAGRSIVCGTPSYLFFHGIDYSEQYLDVARMLEFPGDSAELFETYGVQYAYISGYERSDFAVDEDWFRQNGALAFAQGDVCVYDLSGVHGNSTES